MVPRAVVLFAGLAISGCAAPSVLSVDADAIGVTAARAVVVEPPVDTPPAPPRLGPFRRESPILFQPAVAHATIDPVAKAVRSWAVSGDGSTRVEIGCRKGVRLVDRSGGRTIAAAAEHVAIAADGSQTAHERGGRIYRHKPGAAAAPEVLVGSDAVYLEGAAVAFRRGCQWFATADDGEPPALLGESCGTVLRAERGRARLWIAEFDPPSPAGGDGRPRAAIRTLVGLEQGQPPERVELAIEGPMFAPALAADGSIFCATFDREGSDVLECRVRDGVGFERVAKDVFGTPRFADDVRRLVFTVGHANSPPRELHLLDFDHRIVRRLGRVTHRRLSFLPGGEHVVAFDGGRGLIFDLDTGLVTSFGDEHDDWVALGGAGQPGGFFATRLRTRCAELVHVQLPPPDGSSTVAPG